MAHITFQKRRTPAVGETRQERTAEEPERPRPTVQVGGSSGSGHQPVPEPAEPRPNSGFTEAQMRRRDPVSTHIMGYKPKVSAAERAAKAAKKAAETAKKKEESEQRIKERIAKLAEEEKAKQLRALNRMIKQNQ